MRRLQRRPLQANDTIALAKKQREVDAERKAGTLNVQTRWKAARRWKLMARVLRVLRDMAGTTERCMYCLDSHGTDIEHWRPKASHPEFMFVWDNLLLCCTECGRFKSDQFPSDQAGAALLLDPTVHDPWQHLDFDPRTGLLTPRFDPTTSTFDLRGEATISLLKFDERDAMQEQYRRTWRRLCKVVDATLIAAKVDADRLFRELSSFDDHGLIPWCFSDRGARESPFRELKQLQPRAFQEIALACGAG